MDPTPAHKYERPAPGTRLTFGPLVKVLCDLERAVLDGVVRGLCRAVAGKPLGAVEGALLPAYRAALERGVPRAMAAGWMALLLDDDWDRRGRFALWFGARLGMSARLAVHLRDLPDAALPAALRAELDRLRVQLSCAMPRDESTRPPHVTTQDHQSAQR